MTGAEKVLLIGGLWLLTVSPVWLLCGIQALLDRACQDETAAPAVKRVPPFRDASTSEGL